MWKRELPTSKQLIEMKKAAGLFMLRWRNWGKIPWEKGEWGGAPIMSALDIFFDSALALT